MASGFFAGHPAIGEPKLIGKLSPFSCAGDKVIVSIRLEIVCEQ